MKKNEICNVYDDFRMISEYPEREPSNGCVKWVGECMTCGSKRIFNGNALRYGAIVGRCKKCHVRRKRRKR